MGTFILIVGAIYCIVTVLWEFAKSERDSELHGTLLLHVEFFVDGQRDERTVPVHDLATAQRCVNTYNASAVSHAFVYNTKDGEVMYRTDRNLVLK